MPDFEQTQKTKPKKYDLPNRQQQTHDPKSKNPKQQKQTRIKAGERLSLSGMAKPQSQDYTHGINTSMPEKLRAKPISKEEKQPMQSVTSRYSDRRPQALTEIELDTGDVEIGYDSKKQQSVVNFRQDTQTETQREISQERSATRSLRDEVQLKGNSNDQDFHGGAVSLRMGADKSAKLLNRELKNLPSKTQEKSTVEEVAPFINERQEAKRVKELSQLRHTPDQDRHSIGEAITSLHTLISNKKQRRIQFSKQINRAVSDMKEVRNHDTYYLLLKKKRLERLLEIQEDRDEPVLEDWDEQKGGK